MTKTVKQLICAQCFNSEKSIRMKFLQNDLNQKFKFLICFSLINTDIQNLLYINVSILKENFKIVIKQFIKLKDKRFILEICFKVYKLNFERIQIVTNNFLSDPQQNQPESRMNLAVKSLKQKYNNPHCHHISTIYHQKQPIPQYSGNLFLSGIGGLHKQIVAKYNISSVLTIMDKWTYEYDDVDKKIQEFNLIADHKWIDLEDTSDNTIYPHFEDALAFIQTGLKDKNVLVHCHMGISRSASLVLAFLMKRFGWTLDEAFNHTVDIRDTIGPNQSFWEDLKKYQQVLGNKKPVEKKQQGTKSQQIKKEEKVNKKVEVNKKMTNPNGVQVKKFLVAKKPMVVQKSIVNKKK